MTLVDNLVSMGYPLSEIRQMTLGQGMVFYRFGAKRKNIELAQQATNIRCAVWAESDDFMRYLEDLNHG